MEQFGCRNRHGLCASCVAGWARASLEAGRPHVSCPLCRSLCPSEADLRMTGTTLHEYTFLLFHTLLV